MQGGMQGNRCKLYLKKQQQQKKGWAKERLSKATTLRTTGSPTVAAVFSFVSQVSN